MSNNESNKINKKRKKKRNEMLLEDYAKENNLSINLTINYENDIEDTQNNKKKSNYLIYQQNIINIKKNETPKNNKNISNENNLNRKESETDYNSSRSLNIEWHKQISTSTNNSSIDDENKNKNLICDNNRCVIKNFTYENADCLEDENCEVGYYCDNHRSSGNTRKCKKQIELDGECSLSFECENHLTCFNRYCIDKFFEVKAGESSYYPYDCKYMNAQGGFCVKSVSKKNRSDLKDDDFFPCNENDDCPVDIVKNETDYSYIYYSKRDNCECGFRNNEKKYCPLTNDAFPDLYDQYITLYKKLLKNKCHTRKRFDCSLWPIEHKSDYEKFIGLKIFFEKGHLVRYIRLSLILALIVEQIHSLILDYLLYEFF